VVIQGRSHRTRVEEITRATELLWTISDHNLASGRKHARIGKLKWMKAAAKNLVHVKVTPPTMVSQKLVLILALVDTVAFRRI